DIQHRLKILSDKAEQQHAYLLIFGPLKSGKSTLMNAISGAYVSEVSSLPAYPCLVYVHEGEPRQLSLTTFVGSREEFETEDALHARIETAHAELAEQLRQADREGRNFNPAVDYPRAIRRIDYIMPAPNLRQSGTILVDTPGLYTKMRYNYEQLTRDFRHNAACAVFVVKTDNLFFDQVFDEFKDLLGVFSRVFLVVNIDSSKNDLAPQGELRPALESREPRRIVEAFEQFTASAQLREAIGNGQLRIYLVDLLETAQRSLAGETMLTDEEPAAEEVNEAATAESDAISETGEEEVPSVGGEEYPPETASPSLAHEEALAALEDDAEHGKIGFEAFLRDLTRYLNSSDYIVEFIADSLRQGETLISEIRDGLSEKEVEAFRSETERLEAESEAVNERLSRVAALQKTDWQAAVQNVQKELDEERRSFAETELDALRDRLNNHVSAWFDTEESVADLVQKRLQPEAEGTDAKLRQEAEELARERFKQRNSGLSLDAQTVGHLHKLELSLDDLYADFAAEHAADGKGHAEAPGELPSVDLKQSEVPVKKRWTDWITFRSPRSIRKSLFGNEDPTTRTLSPAVKQKRLGEPARDHFSQQVDLFVRDDLRNRDRKELQAAVESYGEFLEKGIRTRLDATRAELEEQESSLRARKVSSRRVLEVFESLNAASGATLEKADELRQRFVGAPLAPAEGAEASAWEAEAENAVEAPERSAGELTDEVEAAALLDAEGTAEASEDAAWGSDIETPETDVDSEENESPERR
ncbi:MAG: dynamin family protein, partial [Opitutales bacterium]